MPLTTVGDGHRGPTIGGARPTILSSCPVRVDSCTTVPVQRSNGANVKSFARWSSDLGFPGRTTSGLGPITDPATQVE